MVLVDTLQLMPFYFLFLVSKLNTFGLGVFFAWHIFLMNDKIILNRGSKIMVKSDDINFGLLGQVLTLMGGKIWIMDMQELVQLNKAMEIL